MEFTYRQKQVRYTFKVADSGEAQVSTPRMVFDMVKDNFNPIQETMLLLLCDVKNHIIDKIEVAKGGSNSLVITPREIFVHAIKQGARAIFIAHHHPSGDVQPSEEDIIFTRKVKKASDILGIDLLDHLVYSSNDYYSFKQHDLIK